MRRENEQPLVQMVGGGAVHPTRLQRLEEAKGLKDLPAVKAPLSKLQQRLHPQEKQQVTCAHVWGWVL